MPGRILTTLFACLLAAAQLRAQCPGSDSVFRRISWLKSNNIPAATQISELQKLEAAVSRCPNANDSVHEVLLRRLAQLCMGEADFTGRIRYLLRACDLIRANIGTARFNNKNIVKYYYFISEAYDSLHNGIEKRKAWEECIQWSLRLHVPADISAVRALYARTEYLFDIGDYHRCTEDALQCERFARQYAIAEPQYADYGNSFAESSHGWSVQSLLQLREFDSAQQLLTNKAADYKAKGLTVYLAFIYTELAELQLHKGNHRQAQEYYNLALRYYKAAGRAFEYKQTLKSIGEDLWFGFYHDARGAMPWYREALRHNRPPDKRSRVDSIEDASIWNNIANAWVQLGQFDSAFAAFRAAFNQVQPGSDENGILNSAGRQIDTYKKIHYLASLLIDEADAWRKKYIATGDHKAVTEADRIYRLADRLLDRINTVQPDLRSRLFWRSDSRRLYEHAIDLCYLQKNAAGAFYFFEKSRAVLLNDQLAEQWTMGGDVIARQARVKRRVLDLNSRLAAAASGSAMHSYISTNLLSAHQELDSLEQQIKKHNPLYYQGFLDSSYSSIDEVRHSLLADHSSLLEIFYGDSAVYTLLTTAGNTWLDRIDKTAYDNAVQAYLAHLGSYSLLNRDFDGYTRVAYTLFRLLFNGHPLPPGRMIVSPDGRPFPLEALITRPDNNAAGDTPSWMLYDYSISYTYSARYLQNNFADNMPAPTGDFLGVAPVQYPGTRLTPLEGSDASLQQIGRYFGNGMNLVTAQATREKFRTAFSGYRFIQLYTHSSDSSDKKEPVIYFADSALYLSELIPESRPAARLIVLSACETGLGRFYSGEGVFSFNRGFAAMGIPSSVSNLWSVDNNSTYRITELFYKYLSDGQPVDIALRNAKLEFIRSSEGRDRQLPYFWAASIVIGKTNAIDYQRPFHWWWWTGGVLLLIIFVIGVYRYRIVRK
ncbi:MAG: CHAT domain-containing protein [Bacteroidetes bacterium]|nr:CHAT domain-containing protein [Bacteroidota bacterium]